jgi:hypothetical protein
MGELVQAAENLRSAYDLREQVSQHEELFILSLYHQFVTGNLNEARNLRVHRPDNSPLPRSKALEVEQRMRPNRELRIPATRDSGIPPRVSWQRRPHHLQRSRTRMLAKWPRGCG